MLSTPYPTRRFALVAGFFALATSGLQAGAKFTGSTGYEIVKESTAVALEADFIENTSKENATGSLMVKLWALDSPYKGGNLSGSLLGSCKLDGLAGGRHYTDLKKIVPLSMPTSRRNYVICLTLLEFRNGAYGIVDYRNMSKTLVLGPLKLFKLEAPWSWQSTYEGGTVDISVAKITHHRTGKTGSLKLSVWATKEPYNGGRLHGFEIGTVQKPALEAGYSYTSVKNVAKFVPPPDGNYYVSLILTEYEKDGYVMVDYLPASKLSTFRSGKQ